jgi:hypothetical protein
MASCILVVRTTTPSPMAPPLLIKEGSYSAAIRGVSHHGFDTRR